MTSEPRYDFRFSLNDMTRIRIAVSYFRNEFDGANGDEFDRECIDILTELIDRIDADVHDIQHGI